MTSMRVIVLGGTGTIGKALVKRAIKETAFKIRVFSNDENGLYELQQELTNDNIEYILGDIRDYHAVKNAISGMDYIFNAAGLKHVDICDLSPIDAVYTNIIGLNNIIENLDSQCLIFISSDKAVNPSGVMGATKLICEKLMQKGKHKSRFITIRLGNVLHSRGSIMPKIENQIKIGGPVTLTDSRMERYFMTLDMVIDYIIKACEIGKDNIYVPKMIKFSLKTLFENTIRESEFPDTQIKEIGIRKGEKLSEELLSDLEKESCIETKEFFII